MNNETSYDPMLAYPAYADPGHNEHPAGAGEMPANTNTAQSNQDINAWNEAVKQRQTHTFDPRLAASWDGSFKIQGS